MKSKKNRYQETIEIYSDLGNSYLRDIKDIRLKALPDFVGVLPKNSLILDAGCAGGRDSKRFVGYGFKIVGIDLVDIFLKEARKSVPEGKFIKMDLLRLNLPSDYFDAIWAYAVLLHFDKKDVSKILKSFYKILKQKGKIFVGLKEGRGIGYKKEKLSGGKKRTFTFFQNQEVKKLLEESGFEIIFIKNYPDELNRKGVNWIGALAEKRC